MPNPVFHTCLNNNRPSAAPPEPAPRRPRDRLKPSNYHHPPLSDRFTRGRNGQEPLSGSLAAAMNAAIAEIHQKTHSAGGFLPVPGRRLAAASGRDRLDWLHNLVTNAVRSLTPGDGNYAFAINVQGRTLFDLNLLVLDESVWLDIDARWFDDALAHLNKYIVVEDVTLAEITDDWRRFWVLGPKTAGVVAALGGPANFDAMPAMQHAAGEHQGAAIRVVRNDLGPIPRAEIYVDASAAAAFESALEMAAAAEGLVAIEPELLNVIRIEAGVPNSVDDIDHAVIPPETLQVERGISYVKGCYLGQEVLERMRSRGSMARKLVGLKVDASDLPPHNAPVFAGEKEIGRVTSSCHSSALGGTLALGYVKTLLADDGQELVIRPDENTNVQATLVSLPLEYWRKS